MEKVATCFANEHAIIDLIYYDSFLFGSSALFERGTLYR
jgi:hypothetical protein